MMTTSSRSRCWFRSLTDPHLEQIVYHFSPKVCSNSNKTFLLFLSRTQEPNKESKRGKKSNFFIIVILFSVLSSHFMFSSSHTHTRGTKLILNFDPAFIFFSFPRISFISCLEFSGLSAPVTRLSDAGRGSNKNYTFPSPLCFDSRDDREAQRHPFVSFSPSSEK